MSFEHVKPLPRNPSRNRSTNDVLRRMAQNASFEVLARDIVQKPSVLAQIGSDTTVFLPYPPNGAWTQSLEACRLLLAQGCHPVPHLPARRVKDRRQLVEWVESIAALDVDAVMLIAGDHVDDRPAFKDSIDVLQTGILAANGITQVRVAAYPDGHPMIPTPQLSEAFDRKCEIAARDGFTLRVVTQFGFDADPLLAWLTNIHAASRDLPISIGIAGPSRMRTLLKYAAMCGVQHSARGLARNPQIVRMLGRWDPVDVLRPVAEYLAAGATVRVESAHLFTFGGLQTAQQWRDDLLQQFGDDGPRITNE